VAAAQTAPIPVVAVSGHGAVEAEVDLRTRRLRSTTDPALCVTRFVLYKLETCQVILAGIPTS
jgi:hypothetical protein